MGNGLESKRFPHSGHRRTYGVTVQVTAETVQYQLSLEKDKNPVGKLKDFIQLR